MRLAASVFLSRSTSSVASTGLARKSIAPISRDFSFVDGSFDDVSTMVGVCLSEASARMRFMMSKPLSAGMRRSSSTM